MIQLAPLSSKLRFDRYLIDNRPYRFDLPPVELVEHVFCKRDFASVDLKPDETSSWGAIESQAARDARRLTDQELNVEIKVCDFTKIPLQHFAITRQPDRFAVAVYFVMNELLQLNPILPDSRYKHDRCWRDWIGQSTCRPAGGSFLPLVAAGRSMSLVTCPLLLRISQMKANLGPITILGRWNDNVLSRPKAEEPQAQQRVGFRGEDPT